ncbi:16156_t:CDS:2 [Entrophospora sp. SA101]|nr:16156_t:CDS:2 [Entrophospora sp. SA101]
MNETIQPKTITSPLRNNHHRLSIGNGNNNNNSGGIAYNEKSLEPVKKLPNRPPVIELNRISSFALKIDYSCSRTSRPLTAKFYNIRDTKYYKVAEGKTVFSLKVPKEVVDNWFGEERRARSLFICLDISGSMDGAIDQAKEAILQIIEGLVKKGVFTEKNITCFFFNDECLETRFRDNPNFLLSNGEIRKYFDEEIQADGGTSFPSVFESITKSLKRIENDLAIVFFTDGQNNCDGLEDAKTKLADALKKTTYTTEIHSVGFTENHDASNRQGNFIYVKSSDEILSKMKTTTELLELESRSFYAKFDDKELLLADLDEDGTATLVLPRDASSMKDKKVTIFPDLKCQEKCELESQPVHADDPLAAKLTITYIRRVIIRLMNEISNLDENAIDEQDIFYQNLVEADQLTEQLNVVSQAASQNTIRDIRSAKSAIYKFKELLSEGQKGNLSNEKIATFNDLIYGQNKKLNDKKAGSNRYIQDIASFIDDKRFRDVTIKVGPKYKIFKAHSLVLCACSSYFYKELSSNGIDIDKHVVVIPDITAKDFEVLLKYIYDGCDSLDYESSAEVFNLLLAAIKLDLDEVIDYLQLQLTKYHRGWLRKNLRSICDACKEYKVLEILNKYCTDDIIEKNLEMFSSNNFDKLDKLALMELLQSEKLKMDELEIWNKVIKWSLAKQPLINTNPKNWTTKEAKELSASLKDIFPLVRFFQISKDQLFSNVLYPYKKILPVELYDDLVFYNTITGYKSTSMILPPRH